MKCLLYRLGMIPYAQAYDLQMKLWSEKVAGRAEDFLLLLEHPPTLTLGKSGKMQHLLVEREELAKEGLALFFTDRGGDITYHGPGQIVAYPIVDLKRRGKDIHRYVHDLEEAVIGTLRDFSIEAGRDEEHIGVWVGRDKAAAIGVRVRRWITMHGLALNVNPDLGHFALITPCGIADRGVTSMAKILEYAPPLKDVADRLVEHFSRIFDVTLEESPEEFVGSSL
ncbi:MAG: lipoyl(octanoyl) transferase LipB [Deltaproteobacteria bacterium]|nr:lipoyl(octanoyl) transferase LipB [Deltaproteobacteria bacterium]